MFFPSTAVRARTTQRVFRVETSCRFSRRPFHHPPARWEMSSQTGLAENGVILANGERQFSISRRTSTRSAPRPVLRHCKQAARRVRIRAVPVVPKPGGDADHRYICWDSNDVRDHLAHPWTYKEVADLGRNHRRGRQQPPCKFDLPITFSHHHGLLRFKRVNSDRLVLPGTPTGGSAASLAAVFRG